MTEAQLNSKLRMGSNSSVGLLCAISDLEEVVTDFVSEFLDDWV